MNETPNTHFPSGESPQPITVFAITVGFVCKTGFLPSKFVQSIALLLLKLLLQVTSTTHALQQANVLLGRRVLGMNLEPQL
jgi:hypothetical protein